LDPSISDKTFFQIIPKDVREQLEQISTNQHYPKESILFMDGDIAKNLYLIKSGRVKIGKTTLEGKELTLYICQESELIGELALFQPNTTYTTTAEMLDDGEIGVISKKSLEELLSTNGKLALEFMKWMGAAYRRNQSKFRDLILHGKHGALYSTLIRMTNSYGKNVENGILIDLYLTNQELAKFIGTPRESVNRMLSELRKNKIVSIDNGYITIHDLEYLKRFIDCDDCPPDVCRI
jgi:CRP/FNR family transcriptional regulator, cyclic AMP receptor protein